MAHLQQLDDIRMLHELHGGDFSFDLLHHLVLQNLLLVQNLDGHFLPCFDVPRRLHFRKCALAQRLAQVVFPDPRALNACRHFVAEPT